MQTTIENNIEYIVLQNGRIVEGFADSSKAYDYAIQNGGQVISVHDYIIGQIAKNND
jgi:hypothetical protein